MPSLPAPCPSRSHCCSSSASGLGMSEFLGHSSDSSNVQPPIPSDPLTSSVMSKFQASLPPPIQAIHAFNSSQPDHISQQDKNEKRFSMPEEKKGDWFSGARFSCRMSDPSSVGKALHRGVLGWARLHSSLSQPCRNREFSHRSRALLIILLLCPLTLPFTPLTLCEKLHQPASYFSLVAILVGSQTQYSSHYHQTPSQDLLVKNFDTFLPRQQQFTTPGPFLLRALPKDLPPRGSPQKPRKEPPAGMSRLQQVLRRPEWSDQAPGGGGSRFILKEIRF